MAAWRFIVLLSLGASLATPGLADTFRRGWRDGPHRWQDRHAHFHPARWHHHPHRPYAWRHWSRPRWGWSHYRYPSYTFAYGVGYPIYTTSYYDRDAYLPTSPRSRAANGLLLGALAGAVIGNNSGDLRNSAWRGAALGAAAGYAIGAVADHRARRREAENETSNPLATEDTETGPRASSSREETGSASPPTAAPAVPPAKASPMADANRLFGR